MVKPKWLIVVLLRFNFFGIVKKICSLRSAVYFVNRQEVRVGIDKGSNVTGFCCVGNGTILMSGEINHRTDIKEKMSCPFDKSFPSGCQTDKKMDARRANRRNRRARKWYRPKRFLNRASSKRSGRLLPSIKANADEVIRVVRKIPLPITSIVIEDVMVDIARLNNPDFLCALCSSTAQASRSVNEHNAHDIGKAYQESNRLDENLRIATLMRDGYQCTQCEYTNAFRLMGKKKTRFDAHHIIFREDSGKDTLENLLTLCKSCHRKVHQGKKKLDVEGVSGFEDRIAQRTMQGKGGLRSKLLNEVNIPLRNIGANG